jgi:hypothetical protein
MNLTDAAPTLKEFRQQAPNDLLVVGFSAIPSHNNNKVAKS